MDPLRRPEGILRATPRAAGLCLLVGLALSTTSCAALLEGLEGVSVPPPQPPVVQVAHVRLERAPTNTVLARHYCPRLLPALVCVPLFGPPPSVDEVQFVFEVDLTVENPNAFMLPVVELLTAFTAFPGTGDQALGAVCLRFCSDPTTCPQGQPGACATGGAEIRTMQDFAAATVGFLIHVATGEQRLRDLRVKTIAPNGMAHVRVALGLGVSPLLALLERLAKDAIADLKARRMPHFVIPWRIEGTAWCNVEGFGQLAAGFGPRDGAWKLAER